MCFVLRFFLCFSVGGSYNNDNDNAGLWYWNSNTSSNTNSNLGARHLYL